MTTETEIEWSPAVEPGTTIWVTQYFRSGSDPILVENDLGYEVRVTRGMKDNDGDIELVPTTNPRSYARKWRLPITDGLPQVVTNPPVMAGEWVKVTDVMPLATDQFRAAMVDSVRKVYSTETNGIRVVVTPEEMRDIALSGPALITGWEKTDEPKSHDETDGWNPDVKNGDTVWVYKDSTATHLQPDEHRGFDVRTVERAEKDSDGEIMLTQVPYTASLYARKWRLPEENLRPDVKPGDKVKVLGVLGGAADSYRNDVMHKVVEVMREPRDGQCLIHLPAGVTVDGFQNGTITEWALLEKAESHGETPVESPKDWGNIIQRWQEQLTEFACNEGWCSEYEDVVDTLFGWQPVRRFDYTVNVRLTRQRWLSDLMDEFCYRVFDGERDEDRWDLDDEHITINATINFNITCQGKAPTDDEVKEYLDENDFEYDDFYVVDFETIEN